jgi:WS/DGAT/MGAT family acyltransferase
MIEMRGADAYFLWEESRARHMHTLKVVVVDPSAAHEQVSFERVRQGALRLLPRLPAFRRRPVGAPLGLGHPLWLEAPRLDPERHLRHEVLPRGATGAALDELLGRIASEPLDESRPLWRLFFVEGLPGGRIAYVVKLHHALADGLASAELALRLFQPTPERVELPPPDEAEDEPVPPALLRLGRALRRELARQSETPRLLGRSLRSIGVSRRWRGSGGHAPPPAFRSPPTRFNRALTPNRICAHVTLPLPALRRVKDAFACTLNDVYLALVGGALRGYLGGHGELPERALTAAVPVSVRREGEDPAFGNATAYWFATTGTDLADPVGRLVAVAASTRAARELFLACDPHLPVEWLDHWALRRLYLDGLQTVVTALVGRPSYNVIVSNVRGPSRLLYSDGARVEALYSIGPLSRQQGLNFTAWSYRDDFAVGLHACREHVPDLPSLAAALPAELEALERAAGTAARPPPGRREDCPALPRAGALRERVHDAEVGRPPRVQHPLV